jgi:hypothetical protein
MMPVPPFDIQHAAKAFTNELFYRNGRTPQGLELADAQLVCDIIERAMREAVEAANSPRGVQLGSVR